MAASDLVSTACRRVHTCVLFRTETRQSAPIDVMLIIVSVITAAATLQAAGGLDYLVGLAAKFLRKHPTHITYFGPLTTWLFCLVAGTAHTSYSLLPIISEIAINSKIRPERPLSVATISASLGITGSPVSAATAALILLVSKANVQDTQLRWLPSTSTARALRVLADLLSTTRSGW